MDSAPLSAWPPAFPHPLLEEVSRRESADRKKLHWAFFRWLLLGSHYLYLRRPFTQLLFWATLGGLLLWWLVDLTRLGSLVRKCNDQALSKLLDEYHDLLDLRLSGQSPPAAFPEPRLFTRQPVSQPIFDPPAPRREPPAASGLEARPGALVLLSGALVTAIVLYLFNPPPLFPY